MEFKSPWHAPWLISTDVSKWLDNLVIKDFEILNAWVGRCVGKWYHHGRLEAIQQQCMHMQLLSSHCDM